MTEIVRASLGLPTLRAGPQFQNSNAVWVIGSWNLFLIWCLRFGISNCGIKRYEMPFIADYRLLDSYLLWFMRLSSFR